MHIFKRHFFRFITWYVIIISLLVAGATWHHFNIRIRQINQQIRIHAEEKE